MNATLYLPQKPPHKVLIDNLVLLESDANLAPVIERVSELMGCDSRLVDVLARGSNYVAYSVFDYDGEVNNLAMSALTELSSTVFDPEDEDSVLCGPVLIVRTD